MNCWFCSYVMGLVDVTQKKRNDELRQTEYKCHNCGSVYVASEHLIHGPTKTDFHKNTSKEEHGRGS